MPWVVGLLGRWAGASLELPRSTASAPLEPLVAGNVQSAHDTSTLGSKALELAVLLVVQTWDSSRLASAPSVGSPATSALASYLQSLRLLGYSVSLIRSSCSGSFSSFLESSDSYLNCLNWHLEQTPDQWSISTQRSEPPNCHLLMIRFSLLPRSAFFGMSLFGSTKPMEKLGHSTSTWSKLEATISYSCSWRIFNPDPHL